MLKKLFIGAVAGAAIAIAPLTSAVANCDFGGFAMGFSGNMTVASSEFTNANVFEDVSLSHTDKFKYDNGYGFRAFAGWELIPGGIVGVEFGYSDVDFLSKPQSSGQNIDFETMHAAIRIEKYINLESCFDVLFGAYAGISKTDLTGKTNVQIDPLDPTDTEIREFSDDFNNMIFGLRAGVSYNVSDSAALTLNYLLTVLPGIKEQTIKAVKANEGDISFTKLEYMTHGVELGLKWSLNSF